MTSMRADPAEFRGLDVRCHAILSDVPLHDVWTIPLDNGGPDRTIDDVRAILFGHRRQPANLAVRGLFALRWTVGRAFGWDDERHDPTGASYVLRLGESDRSRSRIPPGSRDGPFRVLYVFSDEALSELRNATVHAFLAHVLRRCTKGYTLYLAVYVKPVTRLTPLYMALIDPLRRLIVYPALGRRMVARVRIGASPLQSRHA